MKTAPSETDIRSFAAGLALLANESDFIKNSLAESFYKRYSQQNWKSAGQKINNWQAFFKGWATKELANKQSVKQFVAGEKKQYTQTELSDTDFILDNAGIFSFRFGRHLTPAERATCVIRGVVQPRFENETVENCKLFLQGKMRWASWYNEQGEKVCGLLKKECEV